MKSALIPSSPVRHIDTATMLKYAETGRRRNGKSLLGGKQEFLILYHGSANRLNVNLVPFLDILLVI